jgi:hypothetical protein
MIRDLAALWVLCVLVALAIAEIVAVFTAA